MTALTRPLAVARRAWWGAALAWSGVFAATGFALTAAAAWLRAYAQGALTAPSAGDWFPLAAAVAGGIAIVSVAIAARRAPTPLDLARAADHRFGTEQRLSTALEVAPAPGNLLERALVADAERRAAPLPWVDLGRERWPRRPLLALLPAVALLFAALYLPLPTPVERPTARVAESDDPEQRARDAAALQQFASVLAQVGERERSAYLQAVAASYDDVARRLADGTLDVEAAARALDELAGHLERAAAEVSEAFAQEVRASLTALPGGSDAPVAAADGAAPLRPDAPAAQDAPAAVDAAADPAAAAAAAGPQADASMYTMLQDLANEITNNPGNLGLRAPRPRGNTELGLDESFYGGVARAETDPNAVSEAGGMRVDAPGGGDAVGAADQSSERAGDAAGAGSAALGGGDDAFLAIDAATEAASALPWNEREDGAFVEVELVPDTVLGSARAFAREGGGGAYVRGDEAASTARTIGAAYRDVVGRYFLPEASASADLP